MPIRFPCPFCQAKQSAADHLAGRTLRCGKCSASFVVPATPKAATPSAVKAPAPKPASVTPDDRQLERLRKEGDSDSIFDV
jgi:hypothetical protein